MKTALLILTLLQSIQDVYKAASADFDAGSWTEAAAKYEQVLKEDPSHIPSRFNLAVCYTKTLRLEDAIAAYRTLLDQNSTIYEARVNLALLLEQTGKRVEAGDQFEKALAFHPDDIQAELNLGMFYLKGDEKEKAYPHLVKLVERGLASADVYVALSEIERSHKNEPKAREYIEKALQLDPTNTRL